MKNEIFDPESLSTLRELLQNADKIVVTNHKNPDGDAMGAVLALYHFLKKMGYPANVIVPNEYPKFLKWLPGNQDVMIYEQEVDRANEMIGSADIIFSLDYNDLKRSGDLQEPIENSNARKVLIDHHQDPDDFADLIFSDTASCATAQMIYELIESLDRLELIDADTATCIYTGMVTDTGSFRYASTTSKTHQIAAHLIEIGVRNELVHRNLFDNNTETVLKMRGHVLSNNLVVLPEFKTAYITLSLDEQAKFHTRPGDTEGLVNEALSIEGVVMAAFFKEDHKLIKISFRSVGNFGVNELSAGHFGGGGHRNAAGGSSKISLSETVDRFLEVLPEFKTKLNATK